MKRCYEIREVLAKISFIGATQLVATIGIALGRDSTSHWHASDHRFATRVRQRRSCWNRR